MSTEPDDLDPTSIIEAYRLVMGELEGVTDSLRQVDLRTTAERLRQEWLSHSGDAHELDEVARGG